MKPKSDESQKKNILARRLQFKGNKEPSLKFALFNGFGVRIGDRPDQLLDKLVSSISHQKKSPLPTSNFLAGTVIKEK